MAGFQTAVNVQPTVAYPGDLASTNQLFSYPIGPFGLVAGAAGVTVGNFAWVSYAAVDADGAPAIVNSFGSGPVSGFVSRHWQGVSTVWPFEFATTIPAGMAMALHVGGDFWVKNSGSGQALPGMKAYASLVDGSVTFAATGAATTASATLSTIAAGTAATFTGSITGNVLTAASVTNTIYRGAKVTGGTVATGTVITDQLTGTPGGAGTYAVNIAEQSVASASLTATPYVLDTTGGVVTGTIGLGSVVTSSGTQTGTVNGEFVTVLNAPSAGKYILGPAPGTTQGTAASGTVVLASNVETKWYAYSSGLQNEVVRIYDYPRG
jgi:hypothetical protein